LKLLKLLENNGLLSEEKLSFLIDLDKKSPDAIKKLVKDSGIDPLDIDTSKVSEYKPKTYTVDEREIELDSVLEQIQDTPTYGKLIDLVSTKWDGPSKQQVANNPQLLRVLNDHMANGVYDVIVKEVERVRMLGRFTGVSDLEVYRQVGDELNTKGGFNHLVSAQQKPAATQPTVPAAVPPKAKPVDPKLNEKRRAASSPKAATPAAPVADYNPLNLSDDEFAKLKPQFV
jgi:hypothetical protein